MASLAPEPIFHIGPLTITNAMIDVILIDILLVSVSYYIYKRHKLVPGFLQAILEMIIEQLHTMTLSVAEERTKRIFPYAMSFFFVILFANWTGLFPFLTAIGIWHGDEFIPLVRSASTDLNFTLALGLVSIVATHSMSVQVIGPKAYLNKFFPLHPVNFPIGILELFLEFAKIISFSFRLYGNIFVGKIMLLTATAAFAFLLPVPVLLYETFVGLVQAAIFALLTMAFMAIMTTKTNH